MTKNIERARIRFTIEEDLILLKEVAERNPYESNWQWKEIQQTLVNATQKGFTVRSVREHCDHLIKLFLKDGCSLPRKTGIIHVYQERQQLLNDVTKIWVQYKGNKIECNQSLNVIDSSNNHNNDIVKSETIYINSVNGEIISQAEENQEVIYSIENSQSYTPESLQPDILSTTNASNPSTLVTPSSKSVCNRKPKTKRILANLAWRRSVKERELRLQEKQLALEERRFKLDENKFELEKKERESRLVVEIKERENNISVSQQQQNIINFFIQNFNKPF